MKSRILAIAVVLASFVALPVIAGTYQVDTVHSSVTFMVKHLNTSYAMGRFNNVTGSFTLDEANPAASAFDFTVKVESVDTADAKRDTHLKNADFFNAKQFPTISFKSKSVKSGGTNVFDVTGDLTLHGVTKPIAIKVMHTGIGKNFQGGAIAGIFSTFTIKRSDYGMKGMLQAVGDDVTITVAAEGGAK